MQILFGLQSYPSRSYPLIQSALVNAYLEQAPTEAKSQVPIFGDSGIESWTTVGDGPIRGAVKFDNDLAVVSGDTLYRVNANGNAVALGEVPGSGRVTFGVGSSLAVQSGQSVYIYDGSTVSQLTDPDFQGASQVGWLGGYYIYLKPDTGVFYISNAEAPETIDSLDFATAEGAPDDLVAIMPSLQDVILFGTDSTEIWGLRGGTFPFARRANGVLSRGCIAPYSPAEVDNTFMWLADDKTVRAFRGGVPQQISTTAMSDAFEGYPRVDDAIGFELSFGGRQTYVLKFPTAQKAWQYSANTGLWNELESYNRVWQVNGSELVHGKCVVWDEGNRLGYLSLDSFREWGDILPFRVRSAPVSQGNRWLFHDDLALELETGHQDAGNVTLRWTDDGRNWGDEYWRSLGAIGEYNERVMWHGLGRAKNRVYEAVITDAVKRHFIGAEGGIRLGSY